MPLPKPPSARPALRPRRLLSVLLLAAVSVLGVALAVTPAAPGTGTAAPAPVAPLAASAAAAASAPAGEAPASAAGADTTPASAATEPGTPGAVSSTGQRIYEQTRPRLLQVRTLLKTQDSQSSVGSGFLVTAEGHLITNYHVVSQYALQPKRYRLVYATIDGQQGALQLLAFDVVHDLALLKAADPAPLAGRGVVGFRPATEPLPRGARIFSLGNPLDVGFAVTEGSYNGPVERSFLPTLFFGGSLSPGMSGGPALDDTGRLVGVNVATRRDGEQVSFLVPAAPAAALLARGRAAQPLESPVYSEISRQLLEHEALLTQRFIAQPWRPAGHATYNVPVPQEQFLRCWGQGSAQNTRGLQFERSDCEMDSRIFVSGALLTGYFTVRHEAYDGSKIGPWRFAQRYSASFQNEPMGRDTRLATAPRCTERSVDRAGLPLRAVVCLRAYKKLEGLHELSVLVATLDGRTVGVQGRFDAHGVSFESAQRLTRHYLDGFAWTAPKTASR
jgi:S1-C subfamily serine protease